MLGCLQLKDLTTRVAKHPVRIHPMAAVRMESLHLMGTTERVAVLPLFMGVVPIILCLREGQISKDVTAITCHMGAALTMSLLPLDIIMLVVVVSTLRMDVVQIVILRHLDQITRAVNVIPISLVAVQMVLL